MRILVIGSGGREHALVWKLRQSPLVSGIFVAPGNGGTAAIAENVDADPGDVAALVALARRLRIDFVVPGPELPLTAGIVDAMQAEGIPCFGPSGWCARIEGSKAFAKAIIDAAGVPTAAYGVFTDKEEAKAYVRAHGAPIVVKADGLAAGKGVVVAGTEQEALDALDVMMDGKAFGGAGARVVVEECLVGEEVSLLAFCDGEHALPLPSAQDHKAAYDGDRGPNTGGMGAYSPAPVLPDGELESMTDLVIRPILREMRRQGHPFVGVLYAGLMMTKDGPKVLEYNARFGDPECEPLMLRLDGDLLEIMQACVRGEVDKVRLRIREASALGVVVAAEGYPGAYEKGCAIRGLDEAEAGGAVVFHAGTRRSDGRVLSTGGRVLCVTALGETLAKARDNAYAAVRAVGMEKSRYRSDIGCKGLRRLVGMQAKEE